MDENYENLSHGSHFFPIGLHKTVVQPNYSLGENTKFNILRSVSDRISPPFHSPQNHARNNPVDRSGRFAQNEQRREIS